MVLIVLEKVFHMFFGLLLWIGSWMFNVLLINVVGFPVVVVWMCCCLFGYFCCVTCVFVGLFADCVGLVLVLVFVYLLVFWCFVWLWVCSLVAFGFVLGGCCT